MYVEMHLFVYICEAINIPLMSMAVLSVKFIFHPAHLTKANRRILKYETSISEAGLQVGSAETSRC